MATRASQRRPTNDGKPKFKPIKPPPPKGRSSSPSIPSKFLRYFLAVPLLLIVVALLGYFTYSPHPQEWHNRDLVTSDLSYRDVLSECKTAHVDRTKRHFNTSVLAYVTPWNSKGYDMAKVFRDKFTHVSPVWYQLKCEGNVQLHGGHNVDKNWIDNVRIRGRPLIFPRVTLEGWQLDTILVQQDERKHAMDIISSECKAMQYDGVVLEAWSAWAANGVLDNPILRQKALQFVRELASALHKVKRPRPQYNLQLIFVIPPPSKAKDPKEFTAADMRMLGNAVDGFSLMTYDFSNPYRPGPNAPFSWVRACLHLLLGNVYADKAKQKGGDLTHKGEPEEDNLASKVLVGVNFYGNDFLLPQGGGSVVGHQYVSLLQKHKPAIIWDKEVKEHFFEYLDGTRKHVVYYPSLKSLSLRLEEANAWGAGISIWEIGQGLEYFFDLL